MGRKTFYVIVLMVMLVIFGFLLLQYDKFGFNTPARVFGIPVWLASLVVAGILVYVGANWRPVREPGEFVETPGCLFWGFIGLFFLAVALGVYFTEPIICTGQDGDVCYQYSTIYESRRNDGSTYRYTYRNSGIWVTDAVYYSTYTGSSSSYSGGGSWLSNMDLGDSEAAMLIIILIVLVVIVLSSAFIPNMWVLACTLCLMALYLTILRLHHSEIADANAKLKHEEKAKRDEKPKNYQPDSLLADPPDTPNPELNA